MKTTAFRLAVLSLTLASGAIMPLAAQAQNSPWLVRLRAVNLDSSNKDSTGLGLSINNRIIPEFDISYFFTPNWATELVLTYPQKQDIRSNGTKIGSFKHLPPTLTAQYHFTGMGAFKPYLGAGVNYTSISSVKFDPAVQSALQPSLEKNSFGFAVQAGFDYEIAKNTYLNLDIKKVQIRTDVKSAGTKVGEFKIDPVLLGVGVGWRF
jgi:outer membrane protein